MKKISEYSPKDWENKLFIGSKKIEELKLEVDITFSDKLTYSITPKTLKKVTFIKELSDPIFTEEYAFKDNTVTRFGINISNVGFRKILNEELAWHNKTLSEEIVEQSEKITNISGKTNYETFSKHIQLTKCENYILKEALKYMNDTDQKVILVDIFPRESSQDKKTKEPAGRIDLNKLDTHTVLLYKTEESKILVIDPNNPMFSTHLNKYTDWKIETLCSTALEHKIYSRPEGSNTGFAPDKFRDCIDIAVKLGLLLNQDKIIYNSIEKIINSEVVKLITNNPLLHNMDFTTDNPARAKQSSDIEKVILSNEQMGLIDKELKERKAKVDLDYKNKLDVIKMEYMLGLNTITEERDTFNLEQHNEYKVYLSGEGYEL